MEKMGLERCGVHGKRSYIYCTICKRVVCMKCKECRKHKVITTNELVDRHKDSTTPGHIRVYERDL